MKCVAFYAFLKYTLLLPNVFNYLIRFFNFSALLISKLLLKVSLCNDLHTKVLKKSTDTHLVMLTSLSFSNTWLVMIMIFFWGAYIFLRIIQCKFTRWSIIKWMLQTFKTSKLNVRFFRPSHLTHDSIVQICLNFIWTCHTCWADTFKKIVQASANVLNTFKPIRSFFIP